MGRMSELATDIENMYYDGCSTVEIAKALGVPLLMVEEEVAHICGEDQYEDEFSYENYEDTRMVGDDIEGDEF